MSLAGILELFGEVEEGIGEGVAAPFELLKVGEAGGADGEGDDDLAILDANFQIFYVHDVRLLAWGGFVLLVKTNLQPS